MFKRKSISNKQKGCLASSPLLFLCMVTVCVLVVFMNGEKSSTDKTDSLQQSSTFTPRSTSSISGQSLTELQTTILTATVKVNSANVRAGPGTTFGVVGGVKNGDLLTIYAKNQDSSWLQIDEAGSAWIKASLVEVAGDIAIIDISKPISTVSAIPTKSGNSPQYVSMLGAIWRGVKVYYGTGEKKSYAFQILGGSEDCSSIPSGRGIKVLYEDGTVEWKDRQYILTSGIFFVVKGDPAIDAIEWEEYSDWP